MNDRLNREDHRNIELKAAMVRAVLKFKPEDFIKAHEEYKNRIKRLKQIYKEADESHNSYKKRVKEQ